MSEKPITYSETFYSVQGEGYFTGVPSAWLRFFLCNLQCDGFGQDNPTDPSTHELPYQNIDITDITDIKDLPVWEKGCDSSYSWSKKFKHLQYKNTAYEIVDILRKRMVNEFNPEGAYLHPVSKQTAHLVVTGGEPLMPHAQRAMMDIWDVYRGKLMHEKPQWITWETNGTQKLTKEFADYFSNPGSCNAKLFMSVSPKLFTVSGEPAKRAIKPDVVAEYARVVHSNRRFGDRRQIPGGQLKFVMGPKVEQWEELDDVVSRFRSAGVHWPVTIMPVGARVEEQDMCAGDVANMAQARGYSVSARVHTYLWGNVIGV
jgi:7-carboxy-7-deazaguanine synthase